MLTEFRLFYKTTTKWQHENICKTIPVFHWMLWLLKLTTIHIQVWLKIYFILVGPYQLSSCEQLNSFLIKKIIGMMITAKYRNDFDYQHNSCVSLEHCKQKNLWIIELAWAHKMTISSMNIINLRGWLFLFKL